jgi:hypothetical protein
VLVVVAAGMVVVVAAGMVVVDAAGMVVRKWGEAKAVLLGRMGVARGGEAKGVKAAAAAPEMAHVARLLGDCTLALCI